MAIYFGLAIAAKLALAETFFDATNHIRAYDWAKYSDDEKKAGLNQAQREVDLYLGIDLDTDYDTTDWPITAYPNFRPDYAVFEQAFFILDNTARTRSASTGAKDIESEEYQQEERDTGLGLAPQATRYLRMNTIQIERG